MAATVRVNGRTVVHGKSEGISIAFPDVCRTPGVGEVPYTNVAYSTEAENTSATVYADGQSVMLKDSYFARSVGDEAGTDGGVISGTFNGRASFTNYSFDVMIEGRNVCRLGDPMIHNHGSPANAMSPYEVQPDIVDPQMAATCTAVCMCDFPGGKMGCVRQMLAEGRWERDCHYYDPYVPGVYIEVAVDMKRNGWTGKPTGGSPEVMLSPTVKSKRHSDANGSPLPLPGGDYPYVPKSRRPDIILAKDPGKPLTRDNIKRVLDIKYPPDSWRDGQRKDYTKIDPAGKEPIEVTPDYCGCTPEQVMPLAKALQTQAAIDQEEHELRTMKECDSYEQEKKKEENEEIEGQERKKQWDKTPAGIAAGVVIGAIAAILIIFTRHEPAPEPSPAPT